MLTENQIRNFKHTPGKIQKLWDGAGPLGNGGQCGAGGSLYLEFSKTGVRTWKLRKRQDGKQRVITLGRYPAMSLAQARRERDATTAGVDLMTATFEEMALSYIKKNRGHHEPRWEKYTWNRLEALRTLFKRKMESIKRRDLLTLLEAKQDSAPVLTPRIGMLAVAIFNHAMDRGELDSHPMAGINRALKPAPPKKPRPAVPLDEMPALLRNVWAYDEAERREPVTALALRLAFYTALRAGELLAARWDWVTDSLLSVPAEAMKMDRAHNVPLSRQALATLAELRALGLTSLFLFPSPDKPGKTLCTNALLYSFYNMGYRTKQSTHGIRALFSTIMNSEAKSGRYPFLDKDVIEGCLAHKVSGDNGVRAAYIITTFEEQRALAMQLWADLIDAKRLQVAEQ